MPRFTAPILALALAAAALPVRADDIGQQLYTNYCATCHGATGHGNGVVAEFLTVPVPDLTTIAARNDGAFPMLAVIHIIDGRTGVRPHGDRMPVWGDAFSETVDPGTTGYGSVIETRGRVMSLALYLESIQQ